MSKRVIAIGLDENICSLFREYFALDELSLQACHCVSDAVILLNCDQEASLIIMDTSSLSTDDTQEAVIRLRTLTYMPILVLSSAEASAPALEVGADVCIPPSADICAIFSQAMALIRRYTVYIYFEKPELSAAVLYRGNLVIDSIRHRVMQAGMELSLLPREFRLLAYFARNPGITLTPEQISRAVWLTDRYNNRDVTQVVSSLRHKLGDSKNDPVYIETIYGFGYRFKPSK